MKTEKINENQIQYHFSEEELLKYGLKKEDFLNQLEKVKPFISELMKLASTDFNVPLTTPIVCESFVFKDSCKFLITKTKTREELNDYIAKAKEREKEEGEEWSEMEEEQEEYGEENSFEEEQKGQNKDMIEELLDNIVDYSSVTKEVAKELSSDNKNRILFPSNIIFSFQNFEELVNITTEVNDVFEGKSRLYKDPYSMNYYLFIEASTNTLDEIILIAAKLHECGYLEASEKKYCLKEHCSCIIADDAINQLAGLAVM